MQIRLIRKPGILTILLSGPLREEQPQAPVFIAKPFNGVPEPWLQTSTSLSSSEPVMLGKEAPQLPL